MHHNTIALIIPAFTVFACAAARADSPEPKREAIASAIRKSIPLLEKGAAGSAKQRTCFTCHNQAVPVFALVEAGRRGFTVDNDNLQRQLKHTAEHLNRRREGLLKGRGKVIIDAYALWTLEAGGWEPDETTAAVSAFLLKNQQKSNHWSNPGSRPPSVGSDFTTTYVALRGMAAFGAEQQRAKIEARTKAAGEWLLSATPVDTEDRVFQLRSLQYIDADEKTVAKSVAELIDAQRDDGGWAQTTDLKSDAYATGTALVALLRTGDVGPAHPAVRRGVQFLLDTQLEDGSWHVVSRAKPFQKYFESGFPHSKDQFISIAGSGWATLALSLVIPEEKTEQR
ncbi:MAG: prenyltransferase/squalene oxidase repeat-containing protein [Pirellulaceae bacterium]|jgi:N-acyl-D-amino-acid deacylase|nr:prenyltransferase/squalene oxidase repeat-containing protein [Pirellulaceae bacterium]